MDIGRILRKLCDQKGVEIIEAEACVDHIHMLVSIPPHISVASFMGYLKGKSSLMIFDRHANLKYRYGNRHFWCRGYYVDTVSRNKKAIEEYKVSIHFMTPNRKFDVTFRNYCGDFSSQSQSFIYISFHSWYDKVEIVSHNYARSDGRRFPSENAGIRSQSIL